VSERHDFRDYTAAIYGVVSAPAGARHWERIRLLYHPDARLVRSGLDPDGKPFALSMSFDEYIDNVETLLADVAFTEVEISHNATIFGNAAQVASVYEYSRESAGQQQQGRGVNFLTLVSGDADWRIVSIVWDNERDGLRLRDHGLTKD
jgi:hypothetical protein